MSGSPTRWRLICQSSGWERFEARPHRSPHPLPVTDTLREHAPVLRHVHITLAARDHQVPIIAEIAVPFHHALVTPAGRILAHLFIRHAVEIGTQVDGGLV